MSAPKTTPADERDRRMESWLEISGPPPKSDPSFTADLLWLLAEKRELRDALMEMVDRFESADDEPAYVTRARDALAACVPPGDKR